MRRLILAAGLFLSMASPAHALLAMGISSISDINLGSWSIGDPALSAAINLCIASSGVIPAGYYQIMVTGSNGYNMINGAQQIPYALYWSDAGAGNLGPLGTQLTNSVTLTNRQRANTLDTDCSSTGPNARLTVKVTQADMTAALGGNYTSVITLVITPI